MNYNPDDFLNLIEEAEAQGGVHLSEKCQPQSFRLMYPVDENRPEASQKRSKRFTTTGCNRQAKFLVPLLPDAYMAEHGIDFDPVATEPALVKVCAVDDAMGLWPRFQDAMQSGESFQE